MVSVIVPAYNSEKYIRECLDSAVGQTRRDIEIIVADDGSTDSTRRIVESYATSDPRVKLLVCPHGGVSAARNAALRVASGEWVTFLDSDDALLPRCVEMLLAAAETTGCDIVYGGWTRTQPKNGKDLSVKSPSPVSIRDRMEVIEEVLYQTSGILPVPWGKLYRRECLMDISFEEGLIYEDLDLFYKVRGRDDKIAVLDLPVYFYRDNPASLTNVFSASRLDVLHVTARIEEYMRLNHPRLLPAARDRRLSANFNMLGLLAVHDSDGVYAGTASECWETIRRLRRESLVNPHARLKNKLGIIVSYLGRRVFEAVSMMIY